jgi:hypothetical protein
MKISELVIEISNKFSMDSELLSYDISAKFDDEDVISITMEEAPETDIFIDDIYKFIKDDNGAFIFVFDEDEEVLDFDDIDADYIAMDDLSDVEHSVLCHYIDKIKELPDIEERLKELKRLNDTSFVMPDIKFYRGHKQFRDGTTAEE